MRILRLAVTVCTLLACATDARAQQLVHRATFRSGADSGWSERGVSQTPSGRVFLGPFTKERLTLLLSDLPPHTKVTVAFDLFTIGAWAGSDGKGGPDIWEFGELGGARQVYSTFATTGRTQSYPGRYPEASYGRGTWSFESNTLGHSADSVFHIQRTFSHSAAELLLEFTGNGERWGLDNVAVWVSTTGLAPSAWGSGSPQGQVGGDLVERQLVPRAVGGVSDVIAVAAGDAHSFALAADGSVWGWGSNDLGQTVTGTGPVPRRITAAGGDDLPSFSAIASGSSSALAIGPGGTLWTWGANASGEAGLGFTSVFTHPTQIPNMHSFVAVAAGREHAVALRADGSLWTWGRNDYGQLGLGVTSGPVLTPTAVGMLRTLGASIVAIAAGNQHVVAVDSRGFVWGWGYNGSGQIGGTAFSVATPHRLTTGALSVAAGRDHTLVLLEDGRVSAWGSNEAGQLGTGLIAESRYVKNRAGGHLTGVLAIAASALQSFAMTTDGVWWGFGRNDDGQLGGGAYSPGELLPVPVRDAIGIIAVAAGFQHTLGVGPAPVASVTPANVDFGQIIVGSSSTASVTLTNSGARDVFLFGIDLSGEAFSSGTSDCGPVLPPAQSCRTDVEFIASAAGTFSGTLRFRTNTPPMFVEVTLSGVAVNSEPGTVVNQAPVAQDQAVSAPTGTTIPITLVASDANSDPLTYTVVAAPAHGTLSGMPPALTYTPVPGYVGADAFTFVANDGSVDGNTATVSITVQPVTAVTFTASGANPATGRQLRAEVTFEVDSTTGRLIVTLTNTSTDDVVDPSDILTAVFFDIGSGPTLSPYNARLKDYGQPGGSRVVGGPDGYGNIGGEWAHAGAIPGPLGARSGISAANFDTLFAGANFRGPNLGGTSLGHVDGINYGITSAGDNPATSVNEAVIQNSVVFQATPSFAVNPTTDITNVSFQYGGRLGDPNLAGVPQ